MIAAMLKSAVVLLVAAGVAFLMKRQSAAVRHTVWTAGLIGAMAIPLCTLTLPSWQAGFAGPAVAFFERAMSTLSVVRQTAIGLWIAGATVGILLLLYSAGRLAWVAIGAEPVEDARWSALAEEVRRSLGIRRPVRLLQNRSVPFLGTWGILVPRVLLPRDAESWPDDRIRMVLAHELAHIQRHDWVVQVLADAARAIYWFNPIFWMASSRLRRESEHACDDAVLRLGAAGTRYAEELLVMTRALRSERRLQSPILAMAQPSHLEQRLVALLNPSLNRLAATPWAVTVVAAAAIALTLPLAAVRPAEKASIAEVPSIPAAAPTTTATPQPLPQPASSASNKTAPPSRALPPEDQGRTVVAAEPREAAAPPVATVQPPADATPPPPAPRALPPEDQRGTVVAPEPREAAVPLVAVVQPPANATPKPPFECKVTRSVLQTKTTTLEKRALGDGPWLINEDRTIWAADQPYIANRLVNSVWMRPANTELKITALRLDGDAPQLSVGPAAPYQTGFVGIGLVFPAAGCWEVTATAGDSKLTFVTKVQE